MYGSWMPRKSIQTCEYWCPNSGANWTNSWPWKRSHRYVLALGSPTHPITPDAWKTYTSTYTWATFYGQPHVNFAPLFGHHYSHAYVDFRGIQDAYMREKGIDYFENARRATLCQRAYAIANPMQWEAYGENIWGLTACDGPLDGKLTIGGREREFHTYDARGACFTRIGDDGTLESLLALPQVRQPVVEGARIVERFGSLTR